MKKLQLIFIATLLSFLCVTTSVYAASEAPKASSEHTHHESARDKKDTAPVDINTADANALSTLKGIGKKRAEDIIAYRTQHGAFASVDDLANVKGMGKKRLETLLKNNPERVLVKAAE